MWNKDEMKGKGNQAKGFIKDKAGEITNNPDLEAEGEAERTKGRIQEGVGKARRKTGKAIEEIGRKVAGKK